MPASRFILRITRRVGDSPVPFGKPAFEDCRVLVGKPAFGSVGMRDADAAMSVGVSRATDGRVTVASGVSTGLAILADWVILRGGDEVGGGFSVVQATIEKRVNIRMTSLRRNLDCRTTRCDI